MCGVQWQHTSIMLVTCLPVMCANTSLYVFGPVDRPMLSICTDNCTRLMHIQLASAAGRCLVTLHLCDVRMSPSFLRTSVNVHCDWTQCNGLVLEYIVQMHPVQMQLTQVTVQG
jgi:hypothetical protein